MLSISVYSRFKGQKNEILRNVYKGFHQNIRQAVKILIGLQAALLVETKGNGAKAHSSGGDKPPLRRKQANNPRCRRQ